MLRLQGSSLNCDESCMCIGEFMIIFHSFETKWCQTHIMNEQCVCWCVSSLPACFWANPLLLFKGCKRGKDDTSCASDFLTALRLVLGSWYLKGFREETEPPLYIYIYMYRPMAIQPHKHDGTKASWHATSMLWHQPTSQKGVTLGGMQLEVLWWLIVYHMYTELDQIRSLYSISWSTWSYL